MTANARKYLEKGGPLEIMHGEYNGRLVDVQPLTDGYVCGIYRFPGGACCGGPSININQPMQSNAGQPAKGKEQIDILSALKDFSEATAQLTEAWECASEGERGLLDRLYPFHKSFDEISHDATLWANTFILLSTPYSISIDEEREHVRVPVDFLTAVNSGRNIKPLGIIEGRVYDVFNPPDDWFSLLNLNMVNNLWEIED